MYEIDETGKFSPKTMEIHYFMSNVVLFVCLMVVNATFNNIPVILWRSVLLVKEIGGPGENHPPSRKSLTNFIT